MTAVAHPAAAVGVAALLRRALRGKDQGHTTVTVTRVLGKDGEVVDVATPDTVVVTTAPEEDPMSSDWVLVSFGAFIGAAVLLTGWLLHQARKHVEQLQADVDELKKRPQ